ncbi:prenyltransferase [Haloferax sp. Atlit-4N]|uniref:UbiA family prenyltransferase n=1 Tax=Haloferax sp. Atlit-4N TaxID=2077206 RepID=UPI000E27EADE|nr:UbiA family prenyltransferase [Haloferax sp. Atlit-4N]RDZ50433.1 prenyltransferase [Haloferax sp. Atlit-4N]
MIMSSWFARQRQTESKYSTKLWAFSQINRLPETVGYNLAYVLLAVVIARSRLDLGLEIESLIQISVAFSAAMLTKMQASVADVLHDYAVDKENPEKQQNATAVDEIGYQRAYTILIIELTAGLFLWMYVSLQTSSLLFATGGALFAISGFVYSYPPRIKERGVLNHLVTTGTDVGFVVLPLVILAGNPSVEYAATALGVIFLYTFGYHIMHQAADTYYDQRAGIQTFTQDLGVSTSILLSAICTAIAGVGAGILHAPGGTLAMLLVAGHYLWLYYRVKGMSEREQTDTTAQRFNTAYVATFLNVTFALSLLI